MKLDRELQLEILNYLAANFDEPFPENVFDLEDQFGPTTAFQLLYLHGLELIEGRKEMIPEKDAEGEFAGHRSVGNVRITPKGIDLLQQDGGLSTILRKVTFKLDEDQFKDILDLAVDQSTIPAEQKTAIKKVLETAEETTITTFITKGIESLIKSTPDLLTLFAKAI